MNRDLVAEVMALRGELEQFDSSVKLLASKQARMIRRLRRTVIGLIVVVVALLGVSAVVGSNALQLNAVQDRTSNGVLCPLYEVFLRSYHPERQKPADLAQYEANFQVIRDGARDLGCAVSDTITPTPAPSVRSSNG